MPRRSTIASWAVSCFLLIASSCSAADAQGTITPLPEAISSFGAAICSEHLYVYGGHTGEAHQHSRDNLSTKFVRLKLTDGTEWESLPAEAPLQGLAMVAYEGKLYRIGGMTARNASDADADLYSVPDVSRFDPQAKQWERLPSLPEGRSSHDAVVVGTTLYVLGGWTLNGDGDGTWLSQPVSLDLSADRPAWQTLPEQPFQRRALAISHLAGKLVAVGGIDADGQVSRDTDIFDPRTGEWSTAAALPGEGLNGFGVTAWNLGGKVYVSGSNGAVYVLESAQAHWREVARLQAPRFFHRLLPLSPRSLLAVGGAAPAGHRRDVETIQLESASRAGALFP
ncbi:MAG: hypothetical protein KDA60_05920 [Planctomycetales bacterium]|nr:hypothetical protein [Planctomycetales bacterium]